MNKLSLTVLALAVATSSVSSAQAGFTTTTTFAGTVGTKSDFDSNVDGFLVGTSWDPHNDSLKKGSPDAVNAVIGGLKTPSSSGVTDGYNQTTFTTGTSTMLAESLGQVGKFEGDSSPGEFWELFDYYGRVDPNTTGTETWNNQDFALLSTPQDDLFGSDDTKQQLVVGLKFKGTAGYDAGIQYLTAKSDASAGGFSVWVYEPGEFNVVYVDADGDQKFLNFLNPVYDFDTRGGNAVSHISFYGAGVLVPEPASMVMMGLGGLLVGGALIRRKRKKS